MHHIDIDLDNSQFLTKNQNSLDIGHQKLGNSTKNGKGDHKMKKCAKIGKSK